MRGGRPAFARFAFSLARCSAAHCSYSASLRARCASFGDTKSAIMLASTDSESGAARKDSSARIRTCVARDAPPGPLFPAHVSGDSASPRRTAISRATSAERSASCFLAMVSTPCLRSSRKLPFTLDTLCTHFASPFAPLRLWRNNSEIAFRYHFREAVFRTRSKGLRTCAHYVLRYCTQLTSTDPTTIESLSSADSQWPTVPTYFSAVSTEPSPNTATMFVNASRRRLVAIVSDAFSAGVSFRSTNRGFSDASNRVAIALATLLACFCCKGSSLVDILILPC